MSVKYQPEKLLKRMASRKNVERLLTKKLTLNKAALNAIEDTSILSKAELEDVALGVIKNYRKRADEAVDAGASKAEAVREIVDDPRQLVQRIQNETLYGIALRLKEKYLGEYYTWLPSTAAKPDPKHRKKWGKRFRLGRGEAPGERIGCQCGMEIHVTEKRLKL